MYKHINPTTEMLPDFFCLVVMETIINVDWKIQWKLRSFNPCCNGNNHKLVIRWALSMSYWSCNPCCNGNNYKRLHEVEREATSWVVILVVMESIINSTARKSSRWLLVVILVVMESIINNGNMVDGGMFLL